MKKIFLFFIALLLVISIYNYDIFFRSNPVREVMTEGNYIYLNQPLLNKKLSGLIGTEIYSINLRELKAEIEQDPWIKNAQIVIESPSILAIKIIEHYPLFLWNGKQYIDDDGFLFKPMKLNIKEILVINSKHDSYQFMYELYNDLQMLFSKLNIDIKRLDKDDDMLIIHTSKYKFSVRFSMYKSKIEEFIAVYDQFLSSHNTGEKVKNIDLRYPTGFAVQ